MKCPVCHSDVPDGFAFCNSCGTRLARKTAQTQGTGTAWSSPPPPPPHPRPQPPPQFQPPRPDPRPTAPEAQASPARPAPPNAKGFVVAGLVVVALIVFFVVNNYRHTCHNDNAEFIKRNGQRIHVEEVVCPYCRSGLRGPYAFPTVCIFCEGTGTITQPCHECGGTGRIQ